MDFETRFAEAILETQKIREESYDQKAANKELNKKNSLYTDFSKFYKKSLFQSADEAAELFGFDLRMTQPIYLLIKYTWNDIQSWAEKVKNDEAKIY